MAKADSKKQRELTTIRDTFESIWIAIVLAFVLRAFMFEAFVIPTGSMAPRLLGQHWQVRCPQCGYAFAYGVPRGIATQVPRDKAVVVTPRPQCPNCDLSFDAKGFRRSGDRVFVLKYLYHFSDPQPWDVVVFKNPQDNHQNYIKRLIGLPGETIEIVHGDIFVANSPQDIAPRRIRRKPKRAQDAMWQVIHDNDYRPDPDRVRDRKAPRWEPDSNESWDLSRSDGRNFHFKGADAQAELAFHAPPGAFLPRYGYNEHRGEDKNIEEDRDVCSDLKLSVVLKPGREQAVVSLETTSFDKRFRADLYTDGRAVLTAWTVLGRRQWRRQKNISPLEPGRGYQVALTHVDFRVALWVGDKAVLESTDADYPADYRWLRQRVAEATKRPVPSPRVKILALGGPVDLWHVKVMRDVYYTSSRLRPPPDSDWNGPRGRYADQIRRAHRKDGPKGLKLTPKDIRHRAAEPGYPGWGTTGRAITLAKFPDDPELNEFFCLGDNSPQSLDGRGWVLAAPTLRLFVNGKFQYQLGTVPRYNMIGRAIFVYWPAGFRVPGLPGLPIIPNIGRMRLIR